MIEDKKVEKQIKSTVFWEHMMSVMDQNSLVVTTKSITKAVPGVGDVMSAVDDLTNSKLREHVERKKKELVECLKKTSPSFTIDSVSKEAFIIDFNNLYEAILRLRDNKKVQFMANLFASAHCGETLCDLDEYDEMLGRLNRLSYREIKLLYLLHKNGDTSGRFYQDVKAEVGIDKEIANNMLSSMTQTGFCKEKVGTFLNYTGNSYYTTELYCRFLKLIHVEDGINDADEEDFAVP